MKLNTRKRTDAFPENIMQTRLHEFSEAIKTRMSGIEPIFLQLGQDMQNIYSDSSQLTDIITMSADTVGSQTEGSLVHHIQSIVSDLLKELKDCRETITLNTARMGSSTGELDTLCKICAGLAKTARFLNIVGLNIDVESCRSSEAKNMFHGFGGEVKELAHKIGVIADLIYSDSRSVQSTQISGFQAISTNLQKLSVLSGSAEESVNHALDKVAKLTQLSYRTLDNAATHSQEIQKKVGEIVMSIQFHDIVRQKLEHVILALDDCKALLNRHTDTFDQDSDRKHAKIYFILKVQSAQLAQISSELNSVHTDLKKAFTGISDKTDRMMEYVAGSGVENLSPVQRGKIILSEGKNGGKEAGRQSGKAEIRNSGKELEKEFESINSELENLKRLRNHGQSISIEMMESIKATSFIVSGLAQHITQVNSINMNLQYKALNAIIMTSKLGEKGRTLEVLAREVRLISLDSNKFMEQIVQTLEEVKVITGNLKELDEDNSNEPNENNPEKVSGDDSREVNRYDPEKISDELSQSLESTLNQISCTIKEYQENTAQSVSMSQKLRQNIEKVRKQVDSVAQWAENTGTIRNQLDEILNQIEPLILSMDKAILIEFEDIARRYTMESERVVHQQTSMKGQRRALDTPSDRQTPKKHGTKNEQGKRSLDNRPKEPDKQDDEFDDNVELF